MDSNKQNNEKLPEYDINLTDDQEMEIIERDNDCLNGKTSARDWNDIKRDLKNVYR
jgi:hypothetical protein